MLHWADVHEALIAWLGAASLAMFLGTILAVPVLVVRIPADYFVREQRPPRPWHARHPALRLALRVARNALGVVFVLAGVAMLALPGQGLVTIFIGILLLDYPWKFRFERWLVRRPFVGRTMNWIRRRRGVEALEMPGEGEDGTEGRRGGGG